VVPRVFAAVDLGASGGRVVAGVVESDFLSLETIHRFPNGARAVDGQLRWPIFELYQQVLEGLGHLASRYPQVESVGIDTWGIDYGLLDTQGQLLAEPTSYRDERTATAVDIVHARVPREELFAATGLQFLPFNTVYQIEAERLGRLWERARKVVLLPDLIAFWLTGELRTERTNASTTGLLDARTGDWSHDLLDRLGIPRNLLSPLVSPGTVLGTLTPEARHRSGLGTGTVVTTVGSHDTASAVAGVPALDEQFAYVASGTWSLVGVELRHPVLTPEACAENFSNERGVEDRIRFLHNTGGFWLIQESLREWAGQCGPRNLDGLLDEAADVPSGGPLIDVDDPSFLTPGDMPARIAAAAERLGQRSPRTPVETVRCVTDSLAWAYATTARRSADLAGTSLEVIHLVGGGSQSPLLCQSTADAAGLPVLAGPVEATALGNALVQAGAHGAVTASLSQARRMVAATMAPRRYEPR
jgi:rhamnulokinase